MAMGKSYFDRTDYSVVVKNSLPHPGSWKGESVRQIPLSPPPRTCRWGFHLAGLLSTCSMYKSIG
jgi:hypothetical protein